MLLVKLEFLLLKVGRLFFNAGYRLRAYNAKRATIKCKTPWDDEKEVRYQLAIKQIRQMRDRDKLAGIGA